MIAFKVLWGFLIHDTSECNQGRKGHGCCAMFYRYLKWNLSREGKVTNECRNVPGNDGSIKKTFLQGFINLGDTTTFLAVIFPGPHKSCESTSKGNRVSALWNSGLESALSQAMEREHFRGNVPRDRMPPSLRG